MLLRDAPEYIYRLEDLPEALRVGEDGTQRALKAVYNGNISVRSAEDAIARALQWGRSKGLVA